MSEWFAFRLGEWIRCVGVSQLVRTVTRPWHDLCVAIRGKLCKAGAQGSNAILRTHITAYDDSSAAAACLRCAIATNAVADPPPPCPKNRMTAWGELLFPMRNRAWSLRLVGATHNRRAAGDAGKPREERVH